MTKPTLPPSPNELEVMKDRIIDNTAEVMAALISECNSDQEKFMIATSIGSLALDMIYLAQGEEHFDQFVKDLVAEVKASSRCLPSCPTEKLH